MGANPGCRSRNRKALSWATPVPREVSQERGLVEALGSTLRFPRVGVLDRGAVHKQASVPLTLLSVGSQ